MPEKPLNVLVSSQKSSRKKNRKFPSLKNKTFA